MTAADMVDWDLAISVGSRLAGPGPEVSRSEADAVVAELRADAARSTGLVREYTGLVAADASQARRPAPRRRPAGLDPRQHRELRHCCSPPFVDKVTAKKGPPSGFTKALGSRVTGAEIGAVLGFLGGKVLGQFDPFHAPSGRLLLVAPNIVHVERELERRPHGLPALGLPARGDPPRAVHRGAVDARPPLDADRAPVRDRRADPAPRRRPQADSPRRSRASRRRQPARHPRHARAARDHGPPHRRDVAARGPRRRGDGRRRARASSRRSRRSARSSPSAARASASSTSSCAAPSASTPRWRSTATAPRSSAGSSTRSAWPTSTSSGRTPPTCPPRPRSPIQPPG